LPMTRHRCNLEVWAWRKAAEMGTAHSSRYLHICPKNDVILFFQKLFVL